MNQQEDEPTQPLSAEELAREMYRQGHVEGDIPSGDPLPMPDPGNPVDRADVIGEGAKAFASWCLRFLLVVAALYVVVRGLSEVGSAIIPVLMALLITSVLYPITAGLRRIGVPYGFGALLSLLAGVAVIGAMISLIAPSVINQWPTLADQTAKGIQKVQDWAAGPPFNIHDEQLNLYLQQLTNWLQSHSEDLVSIVMTVGGSVSSGLVALAMTLVIVFFMLKDGHRFVGWVRTVVGRRSGFHVSELFTRIWNSVSGYIRAQAIVSMVDAVFIGGGLWIMSVPLAFPIAILTFMAGFIPIIGAVSAGGVAVLVALVTGGWIQAVIALALVILVQQLEGNVLQPLLQSRVMELHPVVIILAVLLGGGWFGILGAFLAVPVAASIAVVFRYLGDMIDLRAGDRTADQIAWATDDGHVVGGESEKSAAFFQDLVRERVRNNPFRAHSQAEASNPEGDEIKKHHFRALLKRVTPKRRDKKRADDEVQGEQ